ncbi:IclR family transcriptional regulator [Leifsonia sp. NCR5]|uniref:IclR family transcriptional regulator n=1 Tax=Leifsonia sp. NCR5 TaxID=1978342 RepID=UPI0015C4DE4B|nr:IclR family transcriptional regulator [Leifsonia sp. NCR5]
MANSPSGESLITRLVRILSTLDSGHPPMTATAVARLADLPVATVHRLVAELSAIGWLVKDEQGRIGLGLDLWELAHRARSPYTHLLTIARPAMQEVQRVVGQNTQLGVLTADGDEVLYLECYSGEGSVENAATTATRLPAYRSSAGHAILAFADRAVREGFIADWEPSLPGLRHRLAGVRTSGHAVVEGMMHPDTAGVSVPVREPGLEVVAALSVVVPRDPAVIAAVIGPLTEGAERITAALRADALAVLNEREGRSAARPS